MKLCPSCKFPNADDTYFCASCKTGLDTFGQPENSLSDHAVIREIKSIASSKGYLVAAVEQTAILLLVLYALINILTLILGSDSGLEESLSLIVSGAFAGFALLLLVPAAIFCIAFWLIYRECVNKNNFGIKTTGLTMFKSGVICQFAWTALVPLACAIFTLIYVFKTSDRSYNSFTIAFVLIAVIGFIIAILTPFVLHCVFTVKSINRIKETVLTNVPSNRISMYMIVMFFITAALWVVLGIISLFFTDSWESPGPFSLIPIISAELYVRIGIVLLRYKKLMRNFYSFQPDFYKL